MKTTKISPFTTDILNSVLLLTTEISTVNHDSLSLKTSTRPTSKKSCRTILKYLLWYLYKITLQILVFINTIYIDEFKYVFYIFVHGTALTYSLVKDHWHCNNRK